MVFIVKRKGLDYLTAIVPENIATVLFALLPCEAVITTVVAPAFKALKLQVSVPKSPVGELAGGGLSLWTTSFSTD